MSSGRPRVALVVAAVLLVTLAGCSGGGVGGAGTGGDAVRTSGGAGGSAGAPIERSGSATAGSTDLPAIQRRQIVYTGHVVIEVPDFDAARRNLTAAARARGGFVSDAHAERHGTDGGHYRTGRVVLRVPQGNFSAMMARAKAEGTTRSSETSSNDVTDQLVDVGARLDSLRAQRDRLRELYRRANDTAAVLAVERRLSAVQTRIERLEARQQSLERQVAYSTVTVELRERRPEPVVDHWYDVGVVGAVLASVDGVGTTLRALAVGLGYALPYLLVFGVPGGAVVAVWRRRRGG